MIKAVLAKLQLRLTLDAGMGEFFVWLVALPAKMRARELITMARIGWAVTHGVRMEPGATVGTAAAVSREADGAAAVTQPVTGVPVGPSRTAAVATFGRSFITARPPA